MKLRVEKILTDYLKAQLASYATMIVCGHSTAERPLPYIVVDCADPKPFGDIPSEYGLFEATLTVTVADSVHDLTPNTQNERVMSVVEKIEDFEYSGNDLVFNEIIFQGDTDAKDDNNVGNVITYRIIVQILNWDNVQSSNAI